MEVIEVWQQADGFWRWLYRNDEEGTALLSTESHETKDQAIRAAGVAYPGVRIEEGPALVRGVGLGRIAVRTILAAGVAAAAVPAGVSVILRRLRRRRRDRRLRRRRDAP